MRNIVDPPEEETTGTIRAMQILLAAFLLGAGLAIGLSHPDLVRAVVDSVMLLIR